MEPSHTKLKRYWASAVILYYLTISLSSLQFFNFKEVHFGSQAVHYSVGLLIFPFVYSIANFLQYIFGSHNTKQKIFCGGALGVICLIAGFFIFAYDDNQIVPINRTNLMWLLISSSGFMLLSFLVCFQIFKLMKPNVPAFFSFFIACLISECMVSFVSVPIMMFLIHLNSNEILSIALIVSYKVFASMLLSYIIVKLID